MRSSSTALARLALALVLCVLSGVALAGLAFPLIGGIGLASKTAADQFTPEKPPALVLPQRTRILASDNSVIATLFTQNRVPVTDLEQVPPLTQAALIAIEDSRFYEHKGLDVKGTLRAVLHNSSSGSTQGGSTLTQQYVKNLLIETADTEAGQKAAIARNNKRKLQEARYALYLEQHMTKDQILLAYFNIAYYGSGVYGIGTAATHYFSRPLESLDLAQGAMLAGMVQNPTRFDPAVHPDAAVKRRNIVLDRMLELGKITKPQHDRSVREKTGIKINDIKSGCEAHGVKAPFFCDYVRRYLEQGPGGAVLGATPAARQERLFQGGLTIHTTLDPRIQAAAQKAVSDKVPAIDPSQRPAGLNTAAVADTVEPGTGKVKAMAVDRGFGSGKGQTKVNLALGGSSGYQAGSTFKAFVLARALQQGIKPSLTLYSPNRYCPKAFKYVAGDGKCGPSNAGDSESGTFDMARATWASVNTYFIQLEEKTGYFLPAQVAGQLGVRQVDGTFLGSPIEPVASFTFGTGGYSPLAMAGAYATFANQGVFCPPHPITSITDDKGNMLKGFSEPTCKKVLDPDIANGVTSLLRGVIDGSFHGRTGASASIGRPAAGKTGTTNFSTAAWFVGYTPQLATAVWVGSPVPQHMVGVTINGQPYSQVFGGTIPAAIWKQLMGNALDGVPAVDFPDAPLATSVGGQKAVPDVRNQPVAVAQALLEGQGYVVKIGTPVNAGPVANGAVASTVPAIGSRVPDGTTITLIPSTGLTVVTSSPNPTKAPPTGKPTPTFSPKPSKSPNPKPSKSP